MKQVSVLLIVVWFVVSMAPVGPAWAHGLAGKRFFPATLAIEDPFVADELSLPTVLHIKRPARGDEPASVETEFTAELSKRLTRDLGLSLGGELIREDPRGEAARTGFGNLEVGLKYQFFKSDPHETILSLGLEWEVGGTGQRRVGAESFSVLTPALFIGKGFGDLPEALGWLKPFAVTGVLGVKVPTRASTRKVEAEEGGEPEIHIERHPNSLRWGFAVQYSIPYLQSFVKDVGLSAPLSRMIPVVELEFETFLDRGAGGRTEGTVNPGIIWAGKSFQLGLEAVIPANNRTGRNVGVRALLHFFLDDLFPKSLGRPIFGP